MGFRKEYCISGQAKGFRLLPLHLHVHSFDILFGAFLAFGKRKKGVWECFGKAHVRACFRGLF